MPYKVFKVFEININPDPHRGHHAIFVEANADGSGQIFQVTGNVQQGMMYENKPWPKPKTYIAFSHKEPLGSVSEDEYIKMDEICATIPPPPKQYNLGKKLDPTVPLWNCQDWTTEAVQSLRAAKVLVDDRA